MKRLLLWAAILAVIGIGATAVAMRAMPDDAAAWHVDPGATARSERPNDYLIAPPGASAAQADGTAGTYDMPAKDLLFLFDAVARPSDGVRVVAGSIDDLWITYVQRSAVFGFPDYISVKAIETQDGASLVIWSRSRFGHSDMGVNRRRIDAWLAQMGRAS